MDVFWNTIAAYNAATWPVQLLLVAVAAVLTLLLYLRPTRAVRVAMKVFMAALNLGKRVALWIPRRRAAAAPPISSASFNASARSSAV